MITVYAYGIKVMLKQFKIRHTLPGLGIIALGIAGALMQNIGILYGLILAICCAVVLVTFGKLGREYYPYLLFGIGLALLYQTTLMSSGLVGTDLHTEYYYFWLSAENGWDSSIPHNYNVAIGVVLLGPFIANLLHIDGVWVFKAIYPFLFAFVPILLYCIFKKQFGEKTAFLSVFFFIIVPTWSLEMIGLQKQMLGELMFALCAFIIIVSSWRLRIKIPLLIICAILGMLFHYVMGPVILFYLGTSTAILVFFKRRTFPVKWLATTTAILLIAGIGYYGWVGSGTPLSAISKGLSSQIPKITHMISMIDFTPEVVPEVVPTPTPEPIPIPLTEPVPALPPKAKAQGLEPLISTALGLDFMDASPLGKAFRIFQYATQLFLIIGCIYIFRNRKRYSPEYLSFAGASVILMVACLLIPRFANIINATRFYHIILFFLAPALILGGLWVMRNYKVLALCLLIPYFLFTSGFIFESFKCEDIARINIPYSIALSHERVDVAGVFTENDMKVRDFAVENKLEPIFLDINSMLLFSEKIDPFTWSRIVRKDASLFTEGWSYMPKHIDELPDCGYVFLRERNVQKGVVTFKPHWFAPLDSATGMRQSYSFQFMGLDKALEEYEIIYQLGDAMILKVKR